MNVMAVDDDQIFRRIEELERRVKILEEVLQKHGLMEPFEEEDIRSSWFRGGNGYFRWIVERILGKRWKGMPSEAMHYLSTLSDEERKRLQEQWLKEAKEYIEELKRKGKI
jgi:hypothetical protein